MKKLGLMGFNIKFGISQTAIDINETQLAGTQCGEKFFVK